MMMIRWVEQEKDVGRTDETHGWTTCCLVIITVVVVVVVENVV